MQSIGERLEEARKRKGISLREASEATKIRSDFLGNIEKDEFDFELPEIYKRGFIKNYANYLSLDASSILADYDAHLLNTLNSSKKTVGSELFGSMDLKSRTKEETSNKPHLGKISARPNANDPKKEDTHEDEEIDKSFYVKVGLVVLGILAFVIVIIGLIISVLGGGDEPETKVASSSTPPAAATKTVRDVTAESSPKPSLETVSLIASGNVYVLVKQRNDNKELVRKTLGTGETLEFKKEGPIDILFTAGENLVIVNPAGERLRPKGEGTAKISIP